MRALAGHAHDADVLGKLREVARDVGRAAGEPFLLHDLDDGHRRFRRNARDFAPQKFVEHQVADDEDALAGEVAEQLRRRGRGSSGEFLGDGGEEQGNHDFVMADEVEALAAELGRAALDVLGRAVVARHVEGRGGEALDLVAEIARDGQRLEENLGHDDGAADVQHDAALELRADGGECLEIAIGRFAEHRAVRSSDAGG